MSQAMPVIREVYWPALLPQFLAIGTLCASTALLFPHLPVIAMLLSGPAIYLIFCRLSRWAMLQRHTRGMAAYRAGRFDDAIAHFQASHRFFSAHTQLDAWRSLLFGVASRNPYRVIALGNMAWCHGQLGNRPLAIELFEQVLHEVPDLAVANATLNLLRTPPPPNTVT